MEYMHIFSYYSMYSGHDAKLMKVSTNALPNTVRSYVLITYILEVVWLLHYIVFSISLNGNLKV